MAKINLLPWRDELRKKKQQQFLYMLAVAAGLTGLVFVGVHSYIDGLKMFQEQRNNLIQDEIVKLDKQIVEINSIEEKKNKLLAKIELIHKLQASRPEIVHLFDEIPKATPDGVFLNKITQTGANLVFEGKSQSNARVSAFMRAIDVSPWFEVPKLDVIQSPTTADEPMSDFVLHATLGKKQATPAEGGQ